MRTAIIGLQYGDEGKGRVSGYFAKDYDWSVRFNGGPNAGHTVYDDDDKMHKLHHLPAGAVFGKTVALDTGMVIDPEGLKKELAALNIPREKLYISTNVHLISDQHKIKDSDGSGIGSTKRGIAYVYADRSLRQGLRVGDSLSWLGDLNGWEGEVLNVGARWTGYSGLPPVLSGESVLYEGAQGIMLDVDYGAYPYVTSSSIMPSSVHRIGKVIGVMKAYTSRVGDGPPDHPEITELREKGGEYGTTTGRPRKCTWNDINQLRYAIDVVQPDEIVVTKMDVLMGTDIYVYESGKEKHIGDVEAYIAYLRERFPQIKYISFSPKGEMKKYL